MDYLDSYNPKITIIPDNAGEVIFDTILAKKLIENGYETNVLVIRTPRWNDVTFDECKELFDCKVISSFSINHYSMKELNEIAKKEQIGLFIGKGIVNYESVIPSELDVDYVSLLSTKCKGIRKHLGIKDRNVYGYIKLNKII